MAKDKKPKSDNKKDTAKAAQKDKETVNKAEEQAQDQANPEVEVADQESTSNEQEAKTAEEKLQAELDEQKDKYLRLYSEFENFRRRTAKERLELVKTATEDLVKELLPVVDDFERAEKNNQGDDVELKNVLEGMSLIQHKLMRALEGKGVTKIKVEAGDEFDTEFQEAITQIPAPEEKLKGKVVDVIEPGYQLGEKVIRYAKVVTGA